MKIIENPFRGTGLPDHVLPDIPAPSTQAAQAEALLQRCPAAGETPLAVAPQLADTLGIGALHLKDERTRMGLGSFKALGAAYVIACDHQAGTARGRSYVTASAGNHGLSVAAGAAAFGATAEVFLSHTVPESFAGRLRDIGATVIRAGATYEASMEAAAHHAEATGGALLSDSSWHGYTDRPHRLMEGYTVLMAETFRQIPNVPTHVLLQAGVGGLAAAAAAMARAHWGDGPQIIVVEPEFAPALQGSITAGKPAICTGPVSAMGRLDCKEPSLIALKGLARDADHFMTITEEEGVAGAQQLAAAGWPSTPSGAAGVAGLIAARGTLGLDATSRCLCIVSEEAAS